MTPDAIRRDSGDEATHAAAAPAAAYVGLFREPQFLIDLPPIEDDEAVPEQIPSPAERRRRG